MVRAMLDCSLLLPLLQIVKAVPASQQVTMQPTTTAAAAL
jgi:hypothetical protein